MPYTCIFETGPDESTQHATKRMQSTCQSWHTNIIGLLQVQYVFLVPHIHTGDNDRIGKADIWTGCQSQCLF